MTDLQILKVLRVTGLVACVVVITLLAGWYGAGAAILGGLAALGVGLWAVADTAMDDPGHTPVPVPPRAD